MMKILALDISTNAGWALLEDATWASPHPPRLVEYGNVANEIPAHEFPGKYPQTYINSATSIASRLVNLVRMYRPDFIVIEETNLGKNRYSQKLLEFIHCIFNVQLATLPTPPPVTYISSSVWRKKLGIGLSKEDKKQNAKLSKAKSAAKKAGTALDKKSLGIRGKVSKKHVAVRYVNERFNLEFKVKDNDIAEAITLGEAFLQLAPTCNGDPNERR